MLQIHKVKATHAIGEANNAGTAEVDAGKGFEEWIGVYQQKRAGRCLRQAESTANLKTRHQRAWMVWKL